MSLREISVAIQNKMRLGIPTEKAVKDVLKRFNLHLNDSSIQALVHQLESEKHRLMTVLDDINVIDDKEFKRDYSDKT